MGNFEDDMARQAREQQRCKIDLSVVSLSHPSRSLLLMHPQAHVFRMEL